MIASVNHSGDSDSTGAVTGNILGAYNGMLMITTSAIAVGLNNSNTEKYN